MLKEAMEYLISLRKDPVIYDKAGREFTTDRLTELTPSRPEALKVHTLGAIVDYLKNIPDPIYTEAEFIVHIESYDRVTLFEAATSGARTKIMQAEAITPKIIFENFLDPEKFIIMMQSMFVKGVGDVAAVMAVSGNVRDEKVKNVSDDGVSQSVVAKTGVARVSDVTVPNPVTLAPYRTFTEITQPASPFVFRIQDGPKMALFEADGGAWKVEAIDRIKTFLNSSFDSNIKKIKVSIIA